MGPLQSLRVLGGGRTSTERERERERESLGNGSQISPLLDKRTAPENTTMRLVNSKDHHGRSVEFVFFHSNVKRNIQGVVWGRQRSKDVCIVDDDLKAKNYNDGSPRTTRS